jgi:hypothetical protein
MNFVAPAEAAAQLLSLVLFGLIGSMYVAPWLRQRSRADALVPLLWVHVFKYLALQAVGVWQDGFPISANGLINLVGGYVASGLLALVIILLLRARNAAAIPLAWVLVGGTILNTALVVRGGIADHAFGAARNLSWVIVCVYVPVLAVSLVLLIWQLYTRRHEPLAAKATGGGMPPRQGHT